METTLDQSEIGSRFTKAGINLFVAGYRGYGINDGFPTMNSLFQDCHAIYAHFKKILKAENYSGAIFVMGRSLGSMPAIELAYHYQGEIKGLILESGTAQNFKAVWEGADAKQIKKLGDAKFYNKDKIKEITVPTLIIHGEADTQIPVQIAQAMYNLSAAQDKQIVVIPGAGHEDLRTIGGEDFYGP